jgi:pimeloyl-ACP methyl ester carboxylesterase
VLNQLTLIFIHGAGSNPLVWHLQLKRFKEDAIAIQLPGHPTGSGCTSIEEYAKVVEKYIEENHITKPIPVGHSMGGAIAIELALENAKLKGLVLVGTGARLRVRPEFLSKIRENYPEACKEIAQWSVSSTSVPATIQSIAQEMLKVNSEVTYRDFMACDRFDRMKDVERINCPTLIVCGEDDRMTPPKYSQYLHDKIRNSRLLSIPDAGHSVMLEKHRDVCEAIATFLASL